MLVLSRKVHEAIQIGPDIRVVLTEIRGNRVRISVIAPKTTPVHRLEVAQAIDEGAVGCSWCRAVRLAGMWTGPDDPGFEEAKTHGICPPCSREQQELGGEG